MGQKARPTGLRIGIIENWRSRWYADKKSFGNNLVEDFKIRKFIKANYRFAGIPKVEIERTREELKVVLHAARPGRALTPPPARRPTGPLSLGGSPLTRPHTPHTPTRVSVFLRLYGAPVPRACLTTLERGARWRRQGTSWDEGSGYLVVRRPPGFAGEAVAV